MLRFKNLGKRYGDHVVFDCLTYAAPAGCFALTDEPGSGKSTLLSVLGGAQDASVGEIWIDDYSLQAAPQYAKARLSYIPEDCMPDPLITGREYLASIASYRQADADTQTLDLAHRFGLDPHIEKRFEQMSFGTRKKFFLSATLLGEQAVLIADEPSAGLDAPARAVLADLFTLLGRTRTVFFTSYDTALTSACDATELSFSNLHDVQ